MDVPFAYALVLRLNLVTVAYCIQQIIIRTKPGLSFKKVTQQASFLEGSQYFQLVFYAFHIILLHTMVPQPSLKAHKAVWQKDSLPVRESH